ncbi:MAG TPA: ABC transporter ATP-binding protein [Acidimicrobiales bacterium]|nr:ABC transporter ATP-binding protein [Acidimicrobiales bacterium]
MSAQLDVSRGAGAEVAIAGLGFHVGGVNILKDVDLAVATGELLGIIGPNGAGKTTLFNLITGLLAPTEGTIMVRGRNIGRLAPARRARLGMGRTFQTSLLFGALPVYENVRLAAAARLGGNLRFWHRPKDKDAAGAAAAEALESVGLAHLAGRPAGALSHGDKRKLELAILVSSGARLLLLDEPMAGVNVEDVPGLSALIGRLHRDGRTVMMVEHHISVVLGLASRVAVLHHGRLLACGAPDAVMSNETVQDAYLGEPL